MVLAGGVLDDPLGLTESQPKKEDAGNKVQPLLCVRVRLDLQGAIPQLELARVGAGKDTGSLQAWSEFAHFERGQLDQRGSLMQDVLNPQDLLCEVDGKTGDWRVGPVCVLR